jgi:WD40 repeat protein
MHHMHAVHARENMQVIFNPKDTSTFASASLDRTVKVWSLGQPTPNFTLEGHEKGVNCVDYFAGGDRPYLISGADDKLAKVWDYQTKACVQVRPAGLHASARPCMCPARAPRSYRTPRACGAACARSRGLQACMQAHGADSASEHCGMHASARRGQRVRALRHACRRWRATATMCRRSHSTRSCR